MPPNRYTPYFNLESSLTTLELIFVQNLAAEAGYDSTVVPLVYTGTTSPASAPTAIGSIYVNTVTGDIYIASGTSAVGDWELVTGGSGSGVTVETPVGTVNASNTSFVFSATPKWIVSDGITYFQGAGYSLAGLTATMDVAPSQFIRGII